MSIKNCKILCKLCTNNNIIIISVYGVVLIITLTYDYNDIIAEN